MRKMLLLLVGSFCFLPFITLAQTSQASWSKLSGLQPGQAIQIVDTAAKTHSGTFVSVSDRSIVMRDASSERSIQRTDVRQVKLMHSNQRLHHTLIGAAVGAGAGAVVGATAGACSGSCYFGSSRGALAGIGLAIGGIVGTGIGAVLPAHGNTIYKVSSH